MPSRRTVRSLALVLALALLGTLAGCSGGVGDPTADPTPTAHTPTDSPGGDGTAARGASGDGTPAHAGVELAYGDDYLDADDRGWSESAAVEYGDGSAVVTGSIVGIGDRPCLTMDADATRYANGTLLVAVETGSEVPAGNSGCNATATRYEYRAAVGGDRPDRVVVRHSGELGVAFDTLDGRVRELRELRDGRENGTGE